MNTDTHDNPPIPEAMIMWANYHMFSPGHRRRQKRIQSRNLLWCRGGTGSLKINGTLFPMKPGDFIFTPIDFSVTYQAAKHEPFYLGSIHLLSPPRDDRTPLFRVFHSPPSPEIVFPAHDTFEVAGIEGVMTGAFCHSPQTEYLADYIVGWFSSSLRNKDQAITLAHQLLNELIHYAGGLSISANSPPLLLQLQDYIESRQNKPITLADLAANAGCSTATVTRLFRKHLSTPPMHWISKRRMEKAAELLRTTTLRISEIGIQVGIEDPYHFSKLFRKFHGVSATEYRRIYGAF